MRCAHLWPLAVLLVALALLILACRCWRPTRRGRLSAGPRRCRHWRPRTPDDCAHCRQEAHDLGASALPPPAVRPWRESRCRRGAPRRIPTEGDACRTRECPYVGITDSQLHALVADGHHGRTDRIQDFVCQACGHRVSARWGTALSQLKTPPSRIGEVLSALAEGLTVGAAVRVFGTARRPSPAGGTVRPSRPRASTTTLCAISTCCTCSSTRSAPAYARVSGSSGSGWPSIPRPS